MRFFKTTVDAAGEIDLGKQKSINDDRVDVNNEDGVFVVADGVSITHGGSKASSVAVKTVRDKMADLMSKDGALESKLAEAVNEGHRAVIRDNINSYKSFREQGVSVTFEEFPSTTIIVGAVEEGSMCIGHVGDSRAYKITKRGITQLTIDHTMYNVMKAQGMDPSCDPSAEHTLSRFVGGLSRDFEKIHPDTFTVETDTKQITIRGGEQYLLCTDGLNKHVSDEGIAEIIRGAENPKDACDKLIDAANNGGGSDNIGVVVIDAKSQMTPFGKLVSAATSMLAVAGIVAGTFFGYGNPISDQDARAAQIEPIVELTDNSLEEALKLPALDEEFLLTSDIPLEPLGSRKDTSIDCANADTYSFTSRVKKAKTGDGVVVNQEVINLFYLDAGWDGKGRGEDIPNRIGKEARKLAGEAGLYMDELVGKNGSKRGKVFSQCTGSQLGSVEDGSPVRKASLDNNTTEHNLTQDDLPDATEHATLIQDLPDATEYATLIEESQNADTLDTFLSGTDTIDAIEKATYGTLPIRYNITERMNFVEENLRGLSVPETYNGAKELVGKLDDMISKLGEKKDSASFKRAYERQDVTSSDVERVTADLSELRDDLQEHATYLRQTELAESRDMAIGLIGDSDEVKSDYLAASWNSLAENGFVSLR